MLLPLWRAIFKPKIIQRVLSGVTAVVWVLVILAAIGAIVGGGGGNQSQSSSVGAEASPSLLPTQAPTEAPTVAPTAPPSNAANAIAGAQAEFAHVRVYLNAIQDPASSGSQFIQPADGKRFVAFDVTIEFFNDSGTHSASPYNFSLSDVQSFAYSPTFGGPDPALQTVDLHPGEKTRGWVMFEVTNGPLQRLRYKPSPLKDTYIEFNFP